MHIKCEDFLKAWLWLIRCQYFGQLVLLLTAKNVIDLGICLRWGKSAVHCF